MKFLELYCRKMVQFFYYSILYCWNAENYDAVILYNGLKCHSWCSFLRKKMMMLFCNVLLIYNGLKCQFWCGFFSTLMDGEI